MDSPTTQELAAFGVVISVTAIGLSLFIWRHRLPRRLTTLLSKGLITQGILDLVADAWDLLKIIVEEATADSKKKEAAIPPIAERLFALLLPKKDRENVLGDLQEEYEARVTESGSAKARLWFYKQALFSVWPLLRQAIRRRFTSERVK